MAAILLTVGASALLAGSASWVVTAGAAVAGIVGSALDARLFGRTVRQEGPRLDSLEVQASTEGAAIPDVAGRIRIAGQIIWATRFKEVAKTKTQGGKGMGGGVETTTYSYFANFAVALCEGPIDRIGRIWADGKPFDLASVTMRVHRGTDTQDPDPLIEGIEGAGSVPAYRRTAYVVFENLKLDAFGNRIPQLTFEVFRRVVASNGVENLIKAVALIPGAGERVYDPIIQTRYTGAFGLFDGTSERENDSAGRATSDWTVALDDLSASLPNVETVFLVVGWFGDDLRCGACTIRPKVEVADKTTTPNSWAVHGITREGAAIVSTAGGRPAYGGTPSDDSVARAVRDLKARGYAVVLYPFLFMDIASGNALPDPYTGGTGQPAYPWRGRITCAPAPGEPGTVDKTAAAAAQVAAFFGSVGPGDIGITVSATTSAVATSYSGPAEWSYRRFVLHYAKLSSVINAVDPGAIDAFLIGSELRGLCAIRDSATTFPAVAQLKALAAEVKAALGGGVKVGYAADWSDYSAYRPDDGTGDLFFHLDPLWADPAIDFIGVDNYVPLSDWRDGDGHLDAQAGAPSITDPDYLRSNIEGGEYFDWFYASAAGRDGQVRTPITDGTYGKPWVFRAKDFRNWWLNQHFDRPGGIEAALPTAWVPQSKPIWFTEWGVPSIDKGTNQPNVFYDPKSSESFFPYFSRGTRDDLIQRRAHEAMLSYWEPSAGNNPVSSVYGGRMIETIAVWAWDARPFPAWPARQDLWSDGDLWPLGHWLNGKVGLADLAALVAERCARVGFTAVDVSGLAGVVTGYVRDRPMSPRAEIETLMSAFAFDAVESDGLIHFVARGRPAMASLGPNDWAAPERGEVVTIVRAEETDLPDEIGLSFIDGNKDYEPASVDARRLAGWSERRTETGLALVLDETQGRSIADRMLAEAWIGREMARLALPPSWVGLDPGDVVELAPVPDPASGRTYRITRIVDGGARSIEAVRAEAAIYAELPAGIAAPVIHVPPVLGPAALAFLDLPILTDGQVPHAPYAAAAATPFGGIAIMDSPTGEDFALDTLLVLPATMGATLATLPAGPTAYWDTTNVLTVRLYAGELSSRSDEAILSGTVNALGLQNPEGEWEIVQFCNAALVGTSTYALSKLLRGRLGTEHAMGSPLPAGAPVVLLDGTLAQLDVTLAERNVPRTHRWGPPSRDLTDPAWQQTIFTARAVGLMPWSPVHVRGTRNGAGDLTITWIRRTRFGGLWLSGVDVPLNEEREAYEVDVLAGAEVVRTIAVQSPAATYTAAQQASDFDSPQSSVVVRVFQLSAQVGRGRPASAIL